MKWYITYCSKEKKMNAGLLPALERYHDLRIEKVKLFADTDREDFRILSGEFGLLKANDEIPWYDHLLQPEEIEKMAEKVARQLLSEETPEEVLFFMQSPRVDAYALRYAQVMELAAELAGLKIRLVEL
jgi:hypothetical protein